jgi:RNA polymerase sigma-70 factor (ECF subfamily)
MLAVHRDVAELFELEGDDELVELWLQAAIGRKTDGATAVALGAVFERRRSTSRAVSCYLRAAAEDDFQATGRLAVMCEIAGHHDMANLLIELGRSQIEALGADARASGLLGALRRAGSRRRPQLIKEIGDTKLVYWAGCRAVVSNERSIASDCFFAAIEGDHPLATPTLYELQSSGIPETDAMAEVQDIRLRLTQAVKAKTVDIAPPDEERRLDEVVRAVKVGDRTAADFIIRTIKPLVVRYCRARLGRTERTFASADDVAQEVCMAVLTALPSYQDQGRPFLAFVYGIAAHKVIEAHRAAGRNATESVADVPDSPEVSDGPEQQALRFESAGEMGRLLAVLPDKQREILILRIVNGLSAEETAEAVGSTPGAVRVAQHRALGRIRKAMANEY